MNDERKKVLFEALAAVKAEHLTAPVESTDDVAYEAAIRDAECAILRLINKPPVASTHPISYRKLKNEQILKICKMYEVWADHDIEFIYLADSILLEASRQATDVSADDDFKNFHRLLCERFGYVHDEKDWKRDQLSLIECIANWRDQFEYLDVQNHTARQAMRKIMGRLTELLDEDRFAEIEEIVRSAGVEPPASTHPLATSSAEPFRLHAPTVIDHSHPNQAYVTYGFRDEEMCRDFIKRTRGGPWIVSESDAAPIPREAATVPRTERPEWLDGFMHGLLHVRRQIETLQSLGTMKDVPMVFRSLVKIVTRDFESMAEKWAKADKATSAMLATAPASNAAGSNTVSRESEGKLAATLDLRGELVNVGVDESGIGDIEIIVGTRVVSLSGLSVDETKALAPLLFRPVALIAVPDDSGVVTTGEAT